MKWRWTVVFEANDEADADDQVQDAHNAFHSIQTATMELEAEPHGGPPEEEG